MFGVGRTPCSSIIASSRMLYLNNFRPGCMLRVSTLRWLRSQPSLWCSILDNFAYPRSPNIWVQYGFSVFSDQLWTSRHALTPAKTLVMSRTRMPANGNVGEGTAAVASPRRHEGHIVPLSRERDRIGVEIFRTALDEAIILFNVYSWKNFGKKEKEAELRILWRPRLLEARKVPRQIDDIPRASFMQDNSFRFVRLTSARSHSLTSTLSHVHRYRRSDRQ